VEVTDTFDFNAPAESVYNNLTDPDRAARWLPAGGQIAAEGGRNVQVRAGGRRIDLDVTTVPDDLRMTVRCADPVELEGTARVTETPAGGSRVDVVVTALDDGLDPATVRDALHRAMRHLRRDVDDSFTPG
jgi:uncharacterized protein YndB with AHSA1/START domain